MILLLILLSLLITSATLFDQFNGKFCIFITGCCLCTKNECSWNKFHIRMLFDLIIEIHNMKDIQQLTFVLMKTFYLYIKDGIRININSIVLFDIFCKTYFILVFDLKKLLLYFFIICIRRKFPDLGKVCDPAFSHVLSPSQPEAGSHVLRNVSV